MPRHGFLFPFACDRQLFCLLACNVSPVQGCWMVTGIFSEHDLLHTDWQQQQHI